MRTDGFFCYLTYSIVNFFFCFKQKTAYEMRISDWSSDVCSSDLERSCQAAKRSHYAPGRKSEGDDRNSIVALGEARDLKSDGCIENGKSRAAKQAELEVAECQVSLDQFLNDAEEQHVNEIHRVEEEESPQCIGQKCGTFGEHLCKYASPLA